MIERMCTTFVPQCLRVVAAAIMLIALSCHANPQSLSFAQFFNRPIGPQGLEPTSTLMNLRGSAVELRGFAVRPLGGLEGPWILSPVAMTLGDEDESLADDLPASIAYLHSPDLAMQQALHSCPRQVEVTGILDVGRRREADGRFSYIRLQVLDVVCSEGKKS